LSYAPTISVKNPNRNPNPNLTFDFQPQNHVTAMISIYKVWTLWDHSFFELCFEYYCALIDPM